MPRQMCGPKEALRGGRFGFGRKSFKGSVAVFPRGPGLDESGSRVAAYTVTGRQWRSGFLSGGRDPSADRPDPSFGSGSCSCRHGPTRHPSPCDPPSGHRAENRAGRRQPRLRGILAGPVGLPTKRRGV
jgi:hypothetical protein